MRADQADVRREPFASRSPSFLLARKKKGEKEEPGAAFPFQCLAVPGCPCGAPGPQQSSGGGRGGALPQVLRTPCSRVSPAGTGGAQGRCSGRAAAGARGAAPGDVTARRVCSQAPNGISYGALQLPGSLLTRNASSFYTEAEKWENLPSERSHF